MPPLSEITPLVLTFNEEANIGRALDRLTWASRVVVLDSFSTDRTLEICRRYPKVEVLQRAFDDHAAQCNYGLGFVRSPWVLSLDADYILTDELVREMAEADVQGAEGYYAAFAYCVFGRPLRGSLYPPRVILFRHGAGTYRQEGHAHRLHIEGPKAQLSAAVFHDDRKPIDRWLADQVRYSAQEARHLADTPLARLSVPDRIRRGMVLAPVLFALYALLRQRTLLDGWPGWYYAMQRAAAELLLALRLLERSLARPGTP